MKRYIYILLVLLTFTTGCSYVRWVRYTESIKYSDWNEKGGESSLRDSDFYQRGYQYSIDSLSIEAQPFPLKTYTLTAGPAYLPIIPFYQFHLLFDLFGDSKEETLKLKISVHSGNSKGIIDLRDIEGIVNDEENIPITVLVDVDSSNLIKWKQLNILHSDSSLYLIKLSNKPYSFLMEIPTEINKIEKIKINIKGIKINNRSIEVSGLILIRKGKFHFDNLKFGV